MGQLSVRAGNDTPNGLVGVNLSGAEYGCNPGQYGYTFIFPTEGEYAYFESKKFSLVRLPVSWEKLQPHLYGPLDGYYLNLINKSLGYAEKHHVRVILDIHNYGHYYQNHVKLALGTPALPINALSDLWTKLAYQFKDNPAIWAYGIMNEPTGLGAGVWPAAAHGALLAIRAQDMKTTVLIPGDAWSTAQYWAAANPYFPLKDPANNVRYEAHAYFDHDASGTYQLSFAQDKASVDRVEARLTPFVNWLKQHNVKGFIGECGLPANDPAWMPLLDRAFSIMHDNDIPCTYWAAGQWWGSYTLSIEPVKGGGDKPQMAILRGYATKPTKNSSVPAFGGVTTVASTQ